MLCENVIVLVRGSGGSLRCRGRCCSAVAVLLLGWVMKRQVLWQASIMKSLLVCWLTVAGRFS